MKKILLVFLYCICINFNFAQNKKIDSLLVLLKTQKEDTIKANTYIKLCDELRFVSTQKLETYNNKLLQFSQKINYQKGIGHYYWFLADTYTKNSDFEKAVGAAKKAKALLYNSKDWDVYFRFIEELSNFMKMATKFDEAKVLLDNSLIRAKKNNRPINLAIMYNACAMLYSDLNLLKEALVYAKKAINYETTVYIKKKSYLAMSLIYSDLNNYALASEYIDKAIALSVGDPMAIHSLQVNKIRILISGKHYEEALTIGLENEIFFKKFNYLYALNYTHNYLAECYYQLKKYNESYIFINKCLDNKIEDMSYRAKIYEKASKIYLKLNKKKEALAMIDNAINEPKPVTDEGFNLDLFQTKSEVEEALGNYKNALVYYKMQAVIKEKQNALNNKNKLNELQVNLNVKDKNNSIKKLEIAQLQKTVENKKQRENLLYVSVALLLALLSTFFYVRNNRAIKNKNKIIEQTNIKLENEKQLTQKSLVEKETLLKEIHHRVKNNMQLVMSLLNIQAQEANNNISDFVAVSQSRILSMSLIHENLYQTDNLSQVDFKEYVDNLTNSILNAYSNVNTNITLKLEIEPVYFDIQKAIPLGLIINELVNNAYKHAFINYQKGLITLQLIRKNEKYELVVSDNGIGIQKKENAKKTLGLELVEELVFQLDGLLKVANNKGMQYNIQF
ncbi:histidine kinase dimerization/phosphoacceptor domain -containing protein [Flavobacterium sp.]|uniref:tetratricopeptide repeat-containing sensor histidine kinase n=1 Tax=Flavobacterium sp. TaxID=239 RepID=UPI00286E9BAB|nr:histidine kinase dimerization/phosphoacceptor domain -containing protein [Flavobacterium sp.]